MLAKPLTLRWRGPGGSLGAIAAIAALGALPAGANPQPIAAIIGPPGPSAAPMALLSDVSVPAGTPLAVSRATGHFIAADCATKSSAFVVGLASNALSASFIGDCERSSLTLSDWSAITGTVRLSAGQNYFLGVGGGLVLVPPGSPNCVTLVGIAASASTLLISPQSPIQL